MGSAWVGFSIPSWGRTPAQLGQFANSTCTADFYIAAAQLFMTLLAAQNSCLPSLDHVWTWLILELERGGGVGGWGGAYFTLGCELEGGAPQLTCHVSSVVTGRCLGAEAVLD
jgi:hypothetical protein